MNEFKLPNKRQLRVLRMKNTWRYRIEKMKMKIMDKKANIVLNATKDIEKDEFVSLVNKNYFEILSKLHSEFIGMRTIYCQIDENTYNKYKKKCLEYNRICDDKIKKISWFKRMFFGIKPVTESNLLDKYGRVPLVVVKGLFKPEFNFVILGNCFVLKRNKVEGDDMPSITILLSDKKSKDVIRNIPLL